MSTCGDGVMGSNGRLPLAPLMLGALVACGCLAQPAPSDDLTAYLDMGSANMVRLVADPARPYVYVADCAANAVHFLNTATFRIDRTLPVGSSPDAMDLKADGSVLFVALGGGSSVVPVDLTAQTVLAAISVPGTPTAIASGANDRLYVSVHGNSMFGFDVSSLPAALVETTSLGGGLAIAGRAGDRSRIFTHDASTGLTLTEWSVSAGAATQLLNADIASGPPRISSSPDGATFAFVQDTSYFVFTRWPLENGDVPIFRTVDMLRAGTVNVEWDPVAVALCPGGRIAVAHGDSVVNPTTSTSARHRQGTGDLHLFDATYVESARYHLRSRVREGGIACGPDGRVYLILGGSAGNALGVIAR